MERQKAITYRVEVETWLYPLAAKVQAVPFCLDELINLFGLETEMFRVAVVKLTRVSMRLHDAQHDYKERC